MQRKTGTVYAPQRLPKPQKKLLEKPKKPKKNPQKNPQKPKTCLKKPKNNPKNQKKTRNNPILTKILTGSVHSVDENNTTIGDNDIFKRKSNKSDENDCNLTTDFIFQ